MSRGIVVGQRYLSEAEPELGLGVVVEVDDRVVQVAFAAAEESRSYVVTASPLKRVRFTVGDTVSDDEGRTHHIEAVEQRSGVLFYRSSFGEIPEARVAAHTAITGPRERLTSGRTDASGLFDLRAETLRRLHDIRRSPVRGFAGPRIELLPHQFFVAAEVSSRLVPRVLLADETGLGKTIEAGLILSRLVLAGRVARVLVLVPDSLVHQWLVELRRRFQLRFALFNKKRCKAIEDSEPGCNPFSQEQLVLAGLSLLSGKPKRTAKAAAAGWDIVVVDEAHHLEWSRRGASADYRAVETVARSANGLLLLTATPEQLGAEGHFARLRLLDPDRYGDLDAWSRESEGFRETARIATDLLGDAPLARESAAELATLLGLDVSDVLRRSGEHASRDRLLRELIDRHGPGRVMFRNTRAAVSGFPQRTVHRHPLTPEQGRGWNNDATLLFQRLDAELAADLAPRRSVAVVDELDVDSGSDASSPDASAIEAVIDLPADDSVDDAADDSVDDASDDDKTLAALSTAALSLDADPRVEWLAQLLAPSGPRKVLVICSSGAKAEALEAALAARIRVATAVFHEGLKLVQRDRNAAWFAEDDGARLMICSEIGSEGRNFQHAQHLVLFDLPLDPDLVEQRIGRLDRIGQRGIVEIHVPFVKGSGFEVLARWLDEGVGALKQPSMAARALLDAFGARVRDLALGASRLTDETLAVAIDDLVSDTLMAADELSARVEQSRDRLLEMASLRREVADPLIASVRELDADRDLEDYFLRLLEHFHVYAEEADERRYILNPDGTQSPEFPSLDHGETVLTFDRATALVREDLTFATRDHPLLGDAMEYLLASPAGNAAFAMLDDKGAPRLWLEALYILEPVAPPRLHADRFLAPTPVRVILDQHLREPDQADDPTSADLDEGRGLWIAENQATLAPVLSRMATRCEEVAEARAAELRSNALAAMNVQMTTELERLRALAAVNDHVSPEEAPALAAARDELARAIDGARLRPDALRLIWQGPTKDGAPLFARKAKGD